MSERFPLNALQQKFVAEYLADPDHNATGAYKRAGYKATGKSAEVNACRLLGSAKVSVAIERGMRRLLIKADVKALDLLLELRRIAYLDPREVFEWGPDGVTVKESSSLPLDVAVCISEVSQTVTKEGGTIRVKLVDKMAAIEKLGQYLKLWKSIHEHEHTGPDGGPIQFEHAANRIEHLRGAFASAADREEAGGIHRNGVGKPLDSPGHQNGHHNPSS